MLRQSCWWSLGTFALIFHLSIYSVMASQNNIEKLLKWSSYQSTCRIFMSCHEFMFYFPLTGARILYKYLPMCVGLRRLIFLKRCPDMYREDMVQSKVKPTIFTGFTYVLLCECFNLKDAYIASVCTTIDQLRARCCGYSALYLTHFQQQQTQQQTSMEHHSSFVPSSSGNHHHHHHHIPRHHRSTDFSEFDNH